MIPVCRRITTISAFIFTWCSSSAPICVQISFKTLFIYLCNFWLCWVFLIQGSNPHLLCLLPCRHILYHWALRSLSIIWCTLKSIFRHLFQNTWFPWLSCIFCFMSCIESFHDIKMFVEGLWLPLASGRTHSHRELVRRPSSLPLTGPGRWPLSSEPTRLCFLSGAPRTLQGCGSDVSIQVRVGALGHPYTLPMLLRQHP